MRTNASLTSQLLRFVLTPFYKGKKILVQEDFKEHLRDNVIFKRYQNRSKLVGDLPNYSGGTHKIEYLGNLVGQ